MTTVTLKAGNIFVKKKHELADIAKQLDKVTPEAIDLITDTMRDEKAPRKERLRCAEKLIDYKISVTDQMDKSDLNRQIAEIKANGLKTPLVPEDGPKKPAAPKLDMNNIQSV